MRHSINRRSFLSSAGAGAAGLIGLNLAETAEAGTRFRYSWARGAFSSSQLSLIRRALSLVATHVASNSVVHTMFRTARRASIDRRYTSSIRLPLRQDWIRACMHYQLSYYLRRATPSVYLTSYYRSSRDWARAPVGVVRTTNITHRTGRTYGRFQIKINRFWLGRSGTGADAAAWAGVLAHEMMHNLGHLHGVGEYGTHLQINALQQAVYRASQRTRRNRYQLGAPSGFCC